MGVRRFGQAFKPNPVCQQGTESITSLNCSDSTTGWLTKITTARRDPRSSSAVAVSRHGLLTSGDAALAAASAARARAMTEQARDHSPSAARRRRLLSSCRSPTCTATRLVLQEWVRQRIESRRRHKWGGAATGHAVHGTRERQRRNGSRYISRAPVDPDASVADIAQGRVRRRLPGTGGAFAPVGAIGGPAVERREGRDGSCNHGSVV